MACGETALTWTADDQERREQPFHIQNNSKLVTSFSWAVFTAFHLAWELCCSSVSFSAHSEVILTTIKTFFFVVELFLWAHSGQKADEDRLSISASYAAINAFLQLELRTQRCVQDLWFPLGFTVLMFIVLHTTCYTPLGTPSGEEKIKPFSPGKPSQCSHLSEEDMNV